MKSNQLYIINWVMMQFTFMTILQKQDFVY